MEVFKKIRVYTLFDFNEIEVIRLDNGKSIKRNAKFSFSTNRLVIADFEKAYSFLNKLIKELLGSSSLHFNQLILIIHQLPVFEDGLSEIEKRAYRDLAEMNKAIKVYIMKDNSKKLSIQELKNYIRMYKDDLN